MIINDSKLAGQFEQEIIMKLLLAFGGLCVIYLAAANAQPTAQGASQMKVKGNLKIMAAPVFPQDCDVSSGVDVFPQTETRSITGVSVTLNTVRVKYNNQICITTDLSDFIAKIPAMVAMVALPTNNCASYVRPNPVAVIYNSAMAPVGGNKLEFTMNGMMTPWTCRPGLPVISTSWVRNKWGILVPRTSTSPGSDIKNVGVVQPFNGRTSFRLVVTGNVVKPQLADHVMTSLTLGVPGLDMRGFLEAALLEAQPGLSIPQAPIAQVQGAHYDGARLRIWGNY
jgi:hypothetical protein